MCDENDYFLLDEFHGYVYSIIEKSWFRVAKLMIEFGSEIKPQCILIALVMKLTLLDEFHSCV